MIDVSDQIRSQQCKRILNKDYMQRNIKSLIGYRMEATDGDIRKAEEFYFEDTTWVISYLIVKTGNWFLYCKVLIALVWR